MCTAATYKTKDFYFGRTLDYNFSYGDEVVITPRNFPFNLSSGSCLDSHYAIIGMACVMDGFPLYHDGVNEKGLGMAGLNFVGNAVHNKNKTGRDNIAQFEFIQYILGRCANADEAISLLKNINLTDTPFKSDLPPAQLHYIIADKNKTITAEPVADGIKIYDNPVGILTNNPPFDKQIFSLNNYMHLSAENPQNTFSEKLNLKTYSRGMGGLGLPGDLSSQSRFVRAAFVKLNSVSENTEYESINQFFHILGSVNQPKGCCKLENGEYEITLYTSCCNTEKGIYYYTTYGNHQISAIDMRKENINGDKLIRYPLANGEHINMQN